METLKDRMLKAMEAIDWKGSGRPLVDLYAEAFARVAEEDKRQFLIEYITRFSTGAHDGKFRQLLIDQGLKWFDNEYLKSLKSGGNQTA